MKRNAWVPPGIAWVPALVASLAGGAAPARAVPTRSAGSTSAAASILPWIADDYPRAVARAKERRIPIFVESWAPW